MNNTEILEYLEYIAKPNRAERVTITKKNEPQEVYCVSVPGTSFVVKHNDKISVTGNCHRDGLIKLFRTFCEEHPRIVNDEFKKAIYDIARTTYELEERFIDLAFDLGELDLVSSNVNNPLTKEDVKTYIKYLCDRALILMGLKGNFGVKTNPLPWIDLLIGTKEHANFFEAKVTDYQKGGMTGDWEESW